MKQERKRLAAAAVALVVTALCAPTLAAEGPSAVVDRYFSAYRAASVEKMVEHYAPEAVFEDVNQRHRVEGTEQLTAQLGGLVAMHHTMGLVERRRVARGDTVVVEYDYVGTLNGGVLAQSVGKESCPDLDYVLPVTTWFRIEDGKIAHQKDYIDWATFLELREKLLAAGSPK